MPEQEVLPGSIITDGNMAAFYYCTVLLTLNTFIFSPNVNSQL